METTLGYIRTQFSMYISLGTYPVDGLRYYTYHLFTAMACLKYSSKYHVQDYRMYYYLR